MNIAVYEKSTGKILRFVQCAPDHAALQCAEGECFFLNCHGDATHIVAGQAVTTPDLSEAKQRKLLEISERRYAVEVGGVEVQGIWYSTSREGRQCLRDVIDDLTSGNYPTCSWKTLHGNWVELNLSSATTIREAINLHVQSCFAYESKLFDQITSASTVEQLLEIQWHLV